MPNLSLHDMFLSSNTKEILNYTKQFHLFQQQKKYQQNSKREKDKFQS